MGWVSNFFGGTDSATHVIKTAADGVYDGLDKIVYTDEEKADDSAKRRDWILAFADRTLDENSIRNVTRRWLAWSITGWTLFNAQVAIVFAAMGKMDVVKNIIAIANAFYIGLAFSGVVALYFGVQFVRGKK